MSFILIRIDINLPRKAKITVVAPLQHGVSGKTIPIVDVHSDSGSSIQANIKVSKLLPQRPAKRKATVDLSNMDLANENGHDLHEKNVKFSDGVVDHMNVQEGIRDSYHSSRSIFNDLTPRDLIQVVNKAPKFKGKMGESFEIWKQSITNYCRIWGLKDDIRLMTVESSVL